MQVARVLLMVLALCFYFSIGVASDVFEATPTEKEDVKTMDKGTSDVFEATPAEQGDVRTMGKGGSDVFEADPIEQNDMKTIDQLNN